MSESKELQFSYLTISRPHDWRGTVLPLRGEVKFRSQNGEITLQLDERLAGRILDVCADGLVQSTRTVADLMTRDVLNAATSPALAAPDDEPDVIQPPPAPEWLADDTEE